MKCPVCGDRDHLQVAASFWLDIEEETHRNPECIEATLLDAWDKQSLCRCACGWNGVVQEAMEENA